MLPSQKQLASNAKTDMLYLLQTITENISTLTPAQLSTYLASLQRHCNQWHDYFDIEQIDNQIVSSIEQLLNSYPLKQLPEKENLYFKNTLEKLKADKMFKILFAKLIPLIKNENANTLFSILITLLDKFIRDEFMLKAFDGHFASFAKVFAERGAKKELFSYYKKQLMTDKTNFFLLNVYPRDFFIYREFVLMLAASNSLLNNTNTSAVDNLKNLFKHLYAYIDSHWQVETDVKTIFPQETLANKPTLSAQEIVNLTTDFLTKLNFLLDRWDQEVLPQFLLHQPVPAKKILTASSSSFYPMGKILKEIPPIEHNEIKSPADPADNQPQEKTLLGNIYQKSSRWFFHYFPPNPSSEGLERKIRAHTTNTKP